jgi:beta-galactosidase
MQRLSVFLTIIFFAIELNAQTVRERINFDNDWRFAFGHAGDPSKDFNFSIATIFSKNGKANDTAIENKFDDSGWRKLDLPHDWAVALPFVASDNFDVTSHGYKPVGGLYPETSIGWYRKKFEVAKADSGKRFSIQFDGVFRDSQVWLNGFYLGRNESGYIGFTYDVTDYVNFQSTNILVVRVDATQYEGWFYEGAGIYRHVWLNKFDNVHIADDYFVRTQMSGQSASVAVDASIINKGLADANTSVSFTILDRNGKNIASTQDVPTSVKAGANTKTQGMLKIERPTLWSIGNPYRFRLVIDLKSGGKIIDRRQVRFGVRTIEVSAEKGVFVNNVPVKIKGVNCHQDHAGVGAALPDYLQYYRIKLLKEMGTNAYRTSHHPATPELLEACDSLGMLVMGETRLLSSSGESMDQLQRMIVRDRNHPSIFMWSIGNEEGYIQTQSVGKRVALTMLQFQQTLDPTRTSTYAADLGNVFNGVNEVIPVRGFNYREKFVVPYHHDHPNQPVVGTEMGSTVTTRDIYATDSVRGYLPDQDISAPWWASLAEAWWPTAATNDWYMGGFIWTGFDYRGEPTPFKWPNINSHFGVMDVCGFPKNLYYYYKSWWSDEDVIHISPHWNWQGKEGQVIDVWVNSNAETVELLLNGKSLGKKTMPRNSHLKWQVKYEKGTLEARGVRSGRKIMAQVVTTDSPYKFQIMPDRTRINADGKDITIVNIAVVDKKGRVVPTASNLVDFNLKGAGSIIGVGNGDPSSHEADKYSGNAAKRSAFNGYCQVIIQSGKEASELVLTVSSPGLTTGSITITTTAASSHSISSN